MSGQQLYRNKLDFVTIGRRHLSRLLFRMKWYKMTVENTLSNWMEYCQMNLFVTMVVTQDVSVFFHLLIRGINNSDAIDWTLNLSVFPYLAKGSFHLFIC